MIAIAFRFKTTIPSGARTPISSHPVTKLRSLTNKPSLSFAGIVPFVMPNTINQKTHNFSPNCLHLLA
ncbi:Ribose-phosphate pyrophosphokinase [Crocosphaera watsonii WH 0401]|uniref:Ribose-phosphate pyrophosphokinase n=1 Tax=Crocosphaera watsonii WH 0401 TaxID=555881 RepID=T2J7M8_CROWT|nr:Ribose-phosphate pyrophosphokinase [Crocosphaera watsonii WH 0401]